FHVEPNTGSAGRLVDTSPLLNEEMGWSLPILLLLLPASVWGIFDFVPRSYDGTGNNLNFTLWGSANVTQIRSMVDADYADGVSITPGGDRPSASSGHGAECAFCVVGAINGD
ncbi:unnamed protein product, partial [Sphacelaria rigidula]